MAAMRQMMSKLRLTVNESKTRICQLPGERFDFLGYTFGRWWSPRTGGAYLGVRPARKRIARVCATIHELTIRNQTWRDAGEVVARMNRVLIGWANYFSLGTAKQAYRVVDQYTRARLRQWLRRKHKRSGSGYRRWPDEHLHQDLGLVCLLKRPTSIPWATA